jgi:hypothetical protein
VLSIFRTNQLLFSALLIPYIILLRISVFFIPYAWTPSTEGIFSQWMYNWVGSTGVLADCIAMFFVFIQAVMINQIVMKNRLSYEVSLFPGLFYVLIASSIPDFLHLSPILMGNTFFIIALSQLMGIYKKNTVADKIFNVGFWLAIASFFYFSFIVFLLLGVIGIFILRSAKIKEWLMILLGFIVPHILVMVYCFWYDQLDFFQATQFTQNVGFLDFQLNYDWIFYVEFGYFAFLTLIIILSFGSYMMKQNIQVQKKLNVLYWTILLSPISLLFQADIQMQHLLLLSVPFGIFISLNFTKIRGQWSETLHLFLLIAVLVWQFKPYFL